MSIDVVYRTKATKETLALFVENNLKVVGETT